MARKISRDVVARQELFKELYSKRGSCNWCGRLGKTYKFFIEPDSVRYRRYDINGYFCSVSCMTHYIS